MLERSWVLSDLVGHCCYYTEALALAFPFSCHFFPEILTWPDLDRHSVSAQMVISSEGLFMTPLSLTSHHHVMLFYFLCIITETICTCLLCLPHQNVSTRRAGTLFVCLSCVFLYPTLCLTHSKYSLNIFCINQKIMIHLFLIFSTRLKFLEVRDQCHDRFCISSA